MAKLSKAQEKALDRIRTEGELTEASKVSPATIGVLERAGLITVERRVSYRSRPGRGHIRREQVSHWIARPSA
jgi:hypothetical protein